MAMRESDELCGRLRMAVILRVTESRLQDVRLFDSHCHFRSTKPRLRNCLLVSIDEEEWKSVALVPKPCNIAFGVHPWHAVDARGGWQSRLRQMLLQFPSSAVGEIGLCRAGKVLPADFEKQKDVCLDQMRLAHELSRPVSVHCVKSFGAFVDILVRLGKHLPPSIMMHSYGGSADSLRQLVKIGKENGARLYFGFSASVNAKTPNIPDRIGLCVRASRPSQKTQTGTLAIEHTID